MLSLEGNPLVLTPNYTTSVIERIPSLKIVDGNNVPIDQALAAQEALKESQKLA